MAGLIKNTSQNTKNSAQHTFHGASNGYIVLHEDYPGEDLENHYPQEAPSCDHLTHHDKLCDHSALATGSLCRVCEGERVSLLSRKPNTNSTGSSWYASVFLVVNIILGSGLLNFPAAYHQSGGIVTAISIQAVLLVFIVASTLILLYCSDIHESTTYQDVVYTICGERTQMVCAAILSVYSFGACVTFFIVIGDQWDKFLAFAYGPGYCRAWFLRRESTMILTCVAFVLPICFPKRIDFLKYPSAIGVMVVFYVVSLVTIKYFTGVVHPGPIRTSPSHWTDIFAAVSVICFAFQSHVSIIPIYSCLKKRSLKEFSKTLSVAMVICLISYTATASFGYLTFGSDVKADILQSYKPTTDVLVAVIGVAAKMYTSYPIMLFVGRKAIDNLYVYIRKQPHAIAAEGEDGRRITINLVWFMVSLLLAVVAPDIGATISLLGGLAAIFVFIFPGLCLLKLVVSGYINKLIDSTRYYGALVTGGLFLGFGVLVFGVVTYQAIRRDIGQETVPEHFQPTCAS